MRKEVSEKTVVLIFLLFIMVGVLFSYGIYKEYYKVNKISIQALNNDKKILYYIDSIKESPQNGITDVRGWAFKQNQNLKTFKTYVALKNLKTDEVFKINTVIVGRKDVTLHFNLNIAADDKKNTYNYDNSGFLGRFDKSKLKSKGQYEICILYLSDKNTEFVPTGKLLEIN